jgi:hypothetical protein
LIKRLTLILAAFAITTASWCQITITGSVLAKEDHSPIPGVNVVVKGTEDGTVTTSDGTFSLNVVDPNAVLVFSFVGFVTQEYSLNGQTHISVKMKLDCIRDYFDVQKIGIYVSSGVINTPVGGSLTLHFRRTLGRAH